MRYGITCNSLLGLSPSPDEILHFAQEAERVGYHSIVVADHVLIPNAFDASAYPAGIFDPETPWYDPLILLGAIAGVTKTVRLGTGIMVVPYRPAVQQAQAVATLDFISGGRFFYGAGIGWMREEYDALGVPFEKRGRRADEYLQVMKLLWSGTGDAFDGEFIHFSGGRINPLPRQKPHPPIYIGGETRGALRRTARHGDGFYINWKTPAEFRMLLDQLAPEMARHGREVADLYKQLGATDFRLVSEQKENISEYEALGLNEIVYGPSCSSVTEGFEEMKRFADAFF